MRPWKVVFGVGAACAVCCAVPLVSGGALLAVGSAGFATAGTALWAWTGSLAPLAGVLLALAAAGGTLLWWRRRRASRAEPATGCGGGCHANGS